MDSSTHKGPAIDDPQEMTCKDQHFLGFPRVTDRYRPVGVRILVRTDGASEKVRQRFAFGLRLLEIR